MDITTLTFGIKDVVEIVIGAITITSFIFAIKNVNTKNTQLANEALLEVDRTKASLKNEVDILRNLMKEKEESLLQKIAEVRQEQKDSNDKLSLQLTGVNTQLTSINKALSELTGYMKGKEEK